MTRIITALKELFWLKQLAPYIWIPTLIISGISAYYAYQNYKLQSAANRPELVFGQVVFRATSTDQVFLDLDIRNVGARPAENLAIDVVTINPNGDQPAKIGTITGSNSIPKEGFRGAHLQFNRKQFLGLLALCATYTDQSGNGYRDVSFYQFPNFNPQLTAEQGGGGRYDSTDIATALQRKFEQLPLCRRN
jgi:hypothetical protein